jgi:hypothetical protein
MTLFAIQDQYGGQTLMLTAAETPLKALDAYAVSEGFPPYSDLIDAYDHPDEKEGWIYQTRNGLTGAIFTNYEILAVPVTLPLRVSLGQAGYAVLDAENVTLVDAAGSAKEAISGVAAHLVEAALPDFAGPLEHVEAADRALTAALGDAYVGSVPAGREFVAGVLEETEGLDDRKRLAVFLAAELTLDTDPDAEATADRQQRLVTITLARSDAVAIADALELFAGIDEGENTDYDELLRLAGLISGKVTT